MLPAIMTDHNETRWGKEVENQLFTISTHAAELMGGGGII